MSKIYLATLQKQEEILEKLNQRTGGMSEEEFLAGKIVGNFDKTLNEYAIKEVRVGPYLYRLSYDSSKQSNRGELKKLLTMNAVANSSTAWNAVMNSSTAMEAVINSSTAMRAVANSSTAMEAVANSSTAMEAVANSSTAMEAVINSSTAMEAVINSSTAMEALLGSKNTKALKGKDISGRFLPLKAGSNNTSYQAYNGSWSNIGTELGAWLKANSSNPIATEIKAGNNYNIHYYDLDA